MTKQVLSCSVDDCDRECFAKGWCRAHYMRWRRYGDPLGGKPRLVECSVEGCSRKPYARELCQRHYYRWRYHGDPLAGGVTPVRRGVTCSINGCTEPVRARTWCTNHYYRWKRNGDPLGGNPPPQPRIGDGTCSVEACEGTAEIRGWCDKHYQRWKRYGDPVAPDRRIKAKWESCAVADCDEVAVIRGWCARHYQRWRLYGNPEEPPRRARSGEGWRGVNNNGYIVLKVQGVALLEHRVVMEEIIGRPLLPEETVHHKNGIRTDNRPGNLELWVGTRSGQRVADLVAFVVEHYRAEVLAAIGRG